MALSYLTGSVTQGSADAFAEAEIATALSGIGNVSFRVREILFQLPSGVVKDQNDELDVCVSRRSKSAFPNITDRDVIAAVRVDVQITTSGAFVFERIRRFTYTEDDDVRIVEDPIYLDVDSDGLGAAQTIYTRIGYERANISAVDRLTLLTQSLET